MSDFEEIKLDGKTIYLVGTAHVSDESVRQVERAIDTVKPDVVAVELCEQRYQALKEEKRWDDTEITDVIKSGRTHLFLLQILLANFQRKIGLEVGVKPGSEMITAMKIAEERGIRVALVDRNIGITLKRALNSLTLFEKAKFFSGLVGEIFFGGEVNKELIENLKKKDVLSELMEELGKEAPSIKRVLVDERDEYIALSLLSLKAEKVVAVLGAGHIEGVKKNIDALKSFEIIEVKKNGLEEAGKETKSRNYANYIIPGLFLIVLAAGLFAKGPQVAVNMIIIWILAHSIIASFGVLLMLGHPKTIAVTFVSAPFTPFHPLVSVGMLAALTEATARKPKVKDFTELVNLHSLRDYYENEVVRIFLILFVADMMNNITSFLVIPYLAKILIGI